MITAGSTDFPTASAIPSSRKVASGGKFLARCENLLVSIPSETKRRSEWWATMRERRDDIGAHGLN
jgi:hypothetical protein